MPKPRDRRAEEEELRSFLSDLSTLFAKYKADIRATEDRTVLVCVGFDSSFESEYDILDREECFRALTMKPRKDQ